MMNDVRRHIARTMAMALVLLAWSCSNEGSTTAEQVDADSAGEPRAVKIAVTETSWDGHVVSVTRSGETLEALKDKSDREWDFTKTPLMDISVLKADVAKAEGYSWVKVGDTYESNSAFSVLQANGVTLYMTEDLTFSGVTATQGDLRIDVDNRLMINKSGIGIMLPSLKKGQQITVEFSTTSDTKSRNIVPSGSVSSTDAVVSTSTSTHAECVVTMTADGSPTFTVGSGTEGSSVYIYKISVTRAESDGFGLYSSSDRMKVINSHIVWDADIQSWKGISNDAYLMLWPNNIVKCDVAFNGTDKQSKPGYYTFTGNHNFNTKFKECTYDGITFTEGLKMEAGTTISFNVGAFASSDNSATVTIVQSDWQDNGNPHGTPKTIMFDGGELNVANATSIPGGKVYTIKKVAYGSHTITRGSGESGLFYVSVDIPFTAYAPYIDNGSFATADTYSDDPSDYGFVSRNKDAVVFKPYKDNRIDLMYAEHTTSADGVVQLNFKHALGKLSIGTIYNNYGENIKLTQIKLSSTHFCQKGTLNLNTGEWTENKVNEHYEETYVPEALAVLFGTLDIPDKGKLTFPKDVAYTQIPGTTLSFEYTFETDNHTTFSVTREIRIEKGKNIYVNINIGQNHEVVLQ